MEGEDYNLEEEENVSRRPKISSKVYLWEFGQNDPKRDSGSKLTRMGLAKKLKIGQSYNGIVLSSEASVTLSPADKDIIQQYGIAGINCSWNRLDEIPFRTLGKPRCQRKLPLLYAANTVNYGKPFKMNTAEALAASLYIVGQKEDAKSLMESFSYGEEFLRLNFELLEAYSSCSTERDLLRTVDSILAELQREQQEKQDRKQKKVDNNSCVTMDFMDLPPNDSEDEYEYEEVVEEEVIVGEPNK